METLLIEMDHIPDKQDIEVIVGVSIYDCYRFFCQKIISLLSPEKEIWEGESRRGKLYHGFNGFSKVDILQIEMWMNNEQLTCVFRFSQRKFNSLTKNKDMFCEEIEKSINRWNNYNIENNSHYTNVDIFLNKSTVEDAIKLLE